MQYTRIHFTIAAVQHYTDTNTDKLHECIGETVEC